MSALTTQCSLMLVALCWDNPEHGAASSVSCYCLLLIAKACTLAQLYPALCGRPVKCSSAWCTSWTPCSPSPAGTQDGQQGIIYTVPKGGSGRQTFITCPATGGCNKPIGLNIITGHLGGANGANGFLFANRRESLTLLAPYSLSYQLPACICAAILSQQLVNTFAAGPYPLLLSYRGQWPVHRDPVGRRVHGKWRSWGRQPLQRNPGVAQCDQATRARPCLLHCWVWTERSPPEKQRIDISHLGTFIDACDNGSWLLTYYRDAWTLDVPGPKTFPGVQTCTASQSISCRLATRPSSTMTVPTRCPFLGASTLLHRQWQLLASW